MKNLKNLIIIILIGSLITQCTSIIKVAYGFKKPQIISLTKVNKSIAKYNLNYFEHYSITGEGFYDYFKRNTSVNNLMIFNKEGQMISPKKLSICSGSKIDFIDQFTDTSQTITIDTINISSLLLELRTLLGERFHFDNAGAEYTILLTWATFAGKLNDELTRSWAEKLKAKNNISLKVMYICIDPRDFWPDGELDVRIKKGK